MVTSKPSIVRSDAPRSATRGVLDATALLAGTFVAALGLSRFAAGPEEVFEDFALGSETTSVYALASGLPMHCTGVADASGCIEANEARGGRPVVLWLGNSQLHAINQLQPGDETAPATLHRLQRPNGREVLAFTQPNSNPQEQLVLFSHLVDRLPLRAVIIPLVFDDFRNDGVRKTVAEALSEHGVIEILERYEVGRTLLRTYGQRSDDSLAALEGTVQERSEAALNDWLESHWELWERRPQARGWLFGRLHRLRNAAFDISAQTKRKVIPGRLEANMAALGALLEEADRRGIQAIIYIAPLRDDVEAPYVSSEYLAFQKSAASIAEEHDATFSDLRHVVPARYWGRTDSTSLSGEAEIDFMHFQGPGHELLAGAINDLLASTLNPDRQ